MPDAVSRALHAGLAASSHLRYVDAARERLRLQREVDRLTRELHAAQGDLMRAESMEVHEAGLLLASVRLAAGVADVPDATDPVVRAP